MTRRMTRWAACLRILCAVALLFVGFSHQPASATAPTALELTQYVLPDGTLPDICLNDMVGGKAKHVGPVKCEACRIAGAMLMPEPVDLDGAVLAFRRLAALPLVEEALRPRRERPGAPPRAPPVLSA
ncbi:hypothetical protein [Shinella sp. HZN7]|uniref:hypothetical protein n=1 Tax=Shinella sp. (strain HZN7) TaxID=879274 RepID=UPI0007DA4F7A|nr:hypothetical protein [Shinella sp. HZN7]ANH03452.1 hypothetical protein shn_05010 [Shinella sp. HZN7]